MIYLDNAATTFPKPSCVYEKLDYANRQLAFNAGRGGYFKARETEDAIRDARKTIGRIAGVNPENVVFTSSATQALNQIINGLNFRGGETVYISPFEHNAICRPLWNQENISIRFLPFKNEDWSLDVEKMKTDFAIYPPSAVFLSQVSNVTGLELPYKDVFQAAKVYSSVNVLDASQSFGILPTYFTETDLVVFAGHKSLYGPFGIGGIVFAHPVDLKTTIVGGTGMDSLNPEMPVQLPMKYEAGSLNAVAISALKTSAEWVESQNLEEKEKNLARMAAGGLRKLPGVHVFLPENVDSLGIVSFSIEGYTAAEAADILDADYDISVRAGYHCAPFIHDFINSKESAGTVRASFGAFNTSEDVERLLQAVKEISEEVYEF